MGRDFCLLVPVVFSFRFFADSPNVYSLIFWKKNNAQQNVSTVFLQSHRYADTCPVIVLLFLIPLLCLDLLDCCRIALLITKV